MSDSSIASDLVVPSSDDRERKRLNEEVLLGSLITPDRLYVDLALAKDYLIGALLDVYQLPTVVPDTRYIAIVEGLKGWSQRHFDDIALHFPSLKQTTAVLRHRLQDPQRAAWIFYRSPTTPFITTLSAQIAVNVNHSAVIGKKDPIFLTLNTHPLVLAERERHIAGLFFSQLLRVTVEVVCRDPATVSLEEYLSYDEIYTAYFVEYFAREDIRNAYTALKAVSKRLFVRRIFGDAPTPTMHIEQQQTYIQARMDVLTQFTFIPPTMFSAILSKGDSDGG